jgi:hypothetical protein
MYVGGHFLTYATVPVVKASRVFILGQHTLVWDAGISILYASVPFIELYIYLSCTAVSTLHKVYTLSQWFLRSVQLSGPHINLKKSLMCLLNMLTMRSWKKVPVSLAISICHFACNNLRTAKWISIKFNTGNFFSSWLNSHHNNGHFT